MTVRYTLLDLVPVCEGADIATALHDAAGRARQAERLGFHRYWVAEHHGMPGVGSAATAVVLAHVGHATSTIRIGAGGIMLPNHSPLVIAEQFGTLDALFPGRVDLGLGRAPGSDGHVARALRRNLQSDADYFPHDVQELIAYLEGRPELGITAVPGAGADVPVWILGSSSYGAQLAGLLGLPYAFASHFAPAMLDSALALYREKFRPSRWLDAPYAAAGFNVFAADDADTARVLATSMQQVFVSLRFGTPAKLPPPVRDYLDTVDPLARRSVEAAMQCTAIGTQADIEAGLHAFIARTGVQEIVLCGSMFDPAAKLRSMEIAAAALASINDPQPVGA